MKKKMLSDVDIAKAVNDRLVKCGGCGHAFHLSNDYQGPVEAVRCMNCTESVARDMGVTAISLREQMREITSVEQLPFGWPASRWLHPRF